MFSVESSLNTCLFVYGSAGTGKTLILIESLKIKVSRLLSQGKKVRILATTFDDYNTELLNSFATKYLVNMQKNIEVTSLKQLCNELDIKHHGSTPRDTLNRVITTLSDKYRKTDTVILLLVDEVEACNLDQKKPDWRDLEVKENVIWLLGLSPRNGYVTSNQIIPPEIRLIIVTKQPLKNIIKPPAYSGACESGS